MLAKVCAGIVASWLLLCAGFDAGSPVLVAPALAYMTEGSQASRAAQQMDRQRRLDEQEREEANAAVAALEGGAIEEKLSSPSVDYAVVGILGATGAVLYAACRGKGCWPSRRGARRRAGSRITSRIGGPAGAQVGSQVGTPAGTQVKPRT